MNPAQAQNVITSLFKKYNHHFFIAVKEGKVTTIECNMYLEARSVLQAN